jgi:type I restriction enzyme S subunit
MLEVITNNLDLWTSALLTKSSAGRGSNGKQEAYGIKKLRELILEWAVRGKLVPQDSGDEPADSRLSKARLKLRAESKGARRSAWKETAVVSADEKRFDLPKGWAWARVNDTGFFVNGLAFKPTDWGVSGKPIIRIQNLTDPSKSLNYAQGEFPDEVTVRTGDLLVSWSATLDAFIWDRGEAVLNQHIFRAIPCHELVIPGFLYWLLKVSIREMEESDHAHGLVMTHINREPFLAHVVAIPPIAEQHRIVAKVDELMALCDQLEQQQTHSLEAHQTLVETLLGTLTRVASPEELTEAWSRIASHFDTLFTTEHSIDQLKQTILQLAVMGKLVPQDPNDEPASVLLRRIAEAKKKLIEAREIQQPKKHPVIDADAMPFRLPDSWQWAYVWDVAKIITSGSRDWAKHFSNAGAIFVTMGNLSRGDYRLRLDSLRYVNPPPGGEGSRTRLEANDLLISITGDVGNLGLIPEDFGEAYINQHTCLLRFMPDCQNRYFPELMRSPWAKFQFDAPQRGVKNSFRLSDVGEMLIPVPPLAEQHRIVAKVDEFMALCDALKARIKDAQTTQIHLADAIVEQAVA